MTDFPAIHRVLDELGVSNPDRAVLAAEAFFQGTTFQTELLASGKVAETAYFAAMARGVGLDYIAVIEPEHLLIDDEACLEQLDANHRVMFAEIRDGWCRLAKVVAPHEGGWKALAHSLRSRPEMRAGVKVTAPSVLRSALLARSRQILTRRARDHLADTRSDCSARDIIWPWQAFSLGVLSGFLPVALITIPLLILTAMHLLLVSFFIACSALRAIAAAALPKARRVKISLPMSSELPVYTVLVALYDEAEVVPQLLVALGRLQWPRSKLEIKLVCEQDDASTIAAIAAHNLRPYVELILVPPSLPRTKPKALAYALPLTRGELVVLYDAEDRPDPMQLAEAWQRFHRSGNDPCLPPGAAGDCQPPHEPDRQYVRFRIRGPLPWPFAMARQQPNLAASGWHIQSFPPRCAGGDGRMGSVQRYRGCRHRIAAGTQRLPLRDADLANAGRRTGDHAGMAQPACPLAQGLDGDMAGAHAPSARAGSAAGAGFVYRNADIVCGDGVFLIDASGSGDDIDRPVGADRPRSAMGHLADAACRARHCKRDPWVFLLPVSGLAGA
ncbi:glycosyltransferase [Aminobacter anthyllidis]|nr:glycosyltransferase [Aminobacter anthyllidis]MDH4986176.1 glycosyltransferase [Aminobacter anthyllidis]